MEKKRAALYLRVSTDGQTTENQRIALEAVAQRRGWQVVRSYEDNGVSGTKGRDRRPGFDAMLKDAARRRFDVLMFWSIDRVGRSVAAVAQALVDLEAAGVAVYADKEGMDATTPHGRAMLQMAAVFAELEHGMITSRIMAGIDRARRVGTKSGKPIGRAPIAPEVEAAIRARLAAGDGILKAAKAVGVGSGTVQRVRRQAAEAMLR